jgi:hypothetical protein
MIRVLEVTVALVLGGLIAFGLVHLFGDPSSRCACEVAIPGPAEYLAGAEGISVCVPVKVSNVGVAPRVARRK